MINIKINGMEHAVKAGTTILSAARENGTHIPTLCHFGEFAPDSLCRVCLVEVKGQSRLVPACSTAVCEGMEIETNSEQVLESRRMTVDMICRHHRMECDCCTRYSNCELHAVLRELGMDDRKYVSIYHEKEQLPISPAIVKDYSKCILCRRCEAACETYADKSIITMHRGAEIRVGLAPNAESGCISCGQCVRVCSTGALQIHNENKAVRIAMNRGKHLVAAVSPELGDQEYLGKLNSILHSTGFSCVVNASEFINRIGEAPTCPATAIRHGTESIHPEKMFHDWAKGEYAAQEGITPEDIFTVYISGCTALKDRHSCDCVMTQRELDAFILRCSVSRYTMRQVWNDAPVRAYDRFVAAAVPEGRICRDPVCPGGCKNGGGLSVK